MNKDFLLRATSFMGVSRRFLLLLGLFSLALVWAGSALLRSKMQGIEHTYALLNLNVLLLLALVTLIGRQVMRLWRERRRGIAGSRLHVRMTVVLGALTATPAVLMAIFASMFFYFGIQSWFNDRVSTAVNESLTVAQAYLNEHQQVMRADVLAMANDLNREAGLLIGNGNALNQMVQTQSQLRNLSEVMVFTSDGEILARSRLSFSLEFEKPPHSAFEKARGGEVVLMTGDSHDRIRALVKLDRFVDSYLYVGRLVDAAVIEHVKTTESAVREYEVLQGRQAQFQRAATLVFVSVTLLLLLLSVWVGLVFAKQMVTPIGALIQATERVRIGDLAARVDEGGRKDELAMLGMAFNRMTRQLEGQRDELIEANRMLDDRRRFIEAVLAGASSGVIGLDAGGRVNLANLKAAELLQVAEKDLIGRHLSDILPEASCLFGNASEAEIPYKAPSGSTRRTFLVRVTVEEGGLDEGAVVTLDDITALVSAQRKAAWADVARRIAHEIKNPLTPIQLSAERLKRKYLPQIKEDPDTFSHCTDTIVRQVGDIGRMVTEFSSFARMPEPAKAHDSVSDLCRETLVLQRQAHQDVDFVIDLPSGPGVFADFDRAQMNQVLTNLIQNGLDSIEERRVQEPGRGRIHLSLQETAGDVSITVEDNGTGLPDRNREHLVEPYVTTRRRGTGLGLAIVKKILEDHQGSLTMDDVSGGDGRKAGARVTIAFPKRAEIVRRASGA